MNFLIDTHTHFDVSEYNQHRRDYVHLALKNGIAHIVLIGFLANRFDDMIEVKNQIEVLNFDGLPRQTLGCHLAFGLHPLYINQHLKEDLVKLDQYLKKYPNIAIAEIGLDTYYDELKVESVFQKQIYFFKEQIDIAKHHNLPIALHIRKSHADVLKILKQMNYNAHDRGGIAHAFSGGEQEGLAFVKLGFKLGVTGQVTNLNAKKMHRTLKAVVDKYGLGSIVLETDCPDMMPVPCQHTGQINEPANLIFVLDALSNMLGVNKEKLALQLWQNSNMAFRFEFEYPKLNF